MPSNGYDACQQRLVMHNGAFTRMEILAACKARVKLVISGRVQGVGFRHYCVQAARQYGLRGWVRNIEDGSVEVMAEGAEASLEPFVEKCRRGPPAAKVRACREVYATPTGELDAFEVAF